MSSDKEYDFFVSYNKADVEFGERLVRRIEEEDYNGRKLSCFFAEWDITPGQNILIAIEKAQEKSRYVGLVMSPDWETSNWTLLERAMPVYDDPAGLKQKVIPILRRRCVVPPSIRILKWLDFSNDRNFEKEVSKLVAWLKGESLRPRSGSDSERPRQRIVTDSTVPDYYDEVISSNIFPVLQSPELVYSAPSAVHTRKAVFDVTGDDPAIPPFAFDEDTKTIHSLADMREDSNPLKKVVFGQMTSVRAISSDLALGKSTSIIDMLNRSMTRHMRSLGMVYDWTSKKTFFPLETDTGTERLAQWRYGRQPGRTLVRKFRSYYAHRSCKAVFTTRDKQLYLRIVPGWHFTLDGLGVPVPPASMSSLSARWMNIEKNQAVLNDIRFWINLLSKDSERLLLYVGARANLEIATTPILASVHRGIEGDYKERTWYEPVEDELAEVTEASLEETADE